MPLISHFFKKIPQKEDYPRNFYTFVKVSGIIVNNRGMRYGVILISCFTLVSCKVRPAAFMPSASVDHFTQGEKLVFSETETTEILFPKELLKEDSSTGNIEPESGVLKPAKQNNSPKIIFHSVAARPDSIPDQRKTEPLGIAAALTGVTAGLGLLGDYRSAATPMILLVMLAVGASLGIASLVRIGAKPRKYKGRFGGWLAVFLASLPIIYVLFFFRL